jgi:hypothetical protein
MESAIPWCTILAWVAKTLHQIVLRQSTIAQAPTVWIVLLFLSLWPQKSLLQPPNEQNRTVPFTLSQRRRFSRLLKQPLALPRFNAGICANKLYRSYPLRPRQHGYITPSEPTTTQRADFRNFETLKERTLRLQRCTAMLHNSHRSALVSSNKGQKGERRNQKTCIRNLPGSLSLLIHRNARPIIVLCQPPTLQSRSRSRRSLLVSASPPTKSCCTSTWRVILRPTAWLFKLPLACANLLALKPTRVTPDLSNF